MKVSELQKALKYMRPTAEILIAQQESCITDDFPGVERAVALQNFKDGKEVIVLIER